MTAEQPYDLPASLVNPPLGLPEPPRFGGGPVMSMGVPAATMEMRGGTLSGNSQIGSQYNYYGDGAPKLYATLSLTDPGGQRATALRPGERYQLTITTGALPAGGQPLVAGSFVRYRAEFRPQAGGRAIVDLPTPTANLSRQEIELALAGPRQTPASLVLPPQVPIVAASLVLLASVEFEQEGVPPQQAPEIEVAALPVELEGNTPFSAAGAQAVQPLLVPDFHDAPDGLACVWVQRTDAQTNLTAFCKGVPLPGLIPIQIGDDVAYSAVGSDTFLPQLMIATTQHLGKFWAWFNTIAGLERSSRAFTLFEVAESKVPWEFFSQNTEFLGVRRAVSRWAPIGSGAEIRHLSLRSEERSGRVLALMPAAAATPAVIDGYAFTRTADPAQLLAQIGAAPEEIALVYIADADGALDGALQQSVALHAMLYGPVKGQRPIFLVDQPGSATNPTGAGGAPSLAALLLPNLADGLIGVASPRLPAGCPPLGERLLGLLAAGHGPAEALCELRKTVRAELGQKPGYGPGHLIGAFMYVYYGNPLLRLSLRRAAQGCAP